MFALVCQDLFPYCLKYIKYPNDAIWFRCECLAENVCLDLSISFANVFVYLIYTVYLGVLCFATSPFFLDCCVF